MNEKGSLIITRREGESIIVGYDDISIRILGFEVWNYKTNVKMLINAPKSISIHRGEVFDRILDRGGSSSIMNIGNKLNRG